MWLFFEVCSVACSTSSHQPIAVPVSRATPRHPDSKEGKISKVFPVTFAIISVHTLFLEPPPIKRIGSLNLGKRFKQSLIAKATPSYILLSISKLIF